MLIGLSGPARCGKDSIANVLITHHGYRRVAFADKLREGLYALNPWVSPKYVVDPKKPREREFEIKDAFEAFPVGRWELREVVDRVGWEMAKELPEVRGLLQRLGTEVGRMLWGEDAWIVAAFPQGVDWRENVVVTDVRFDNEAQFVRGSGGVIVHVSRPGVGPVNGHVSDAGIRREYYDYEVENDGTLGDLRGKVEGVLEAIQRAITDRPYVPGVSEKSPMSRAYARNYMRS